MTGCSPPSPSRHATCSFHREKRFSPFFPFWPASNCAAPYNSHMNFNFLIVYETTLTLKKKHFAPWKLIMTEGASRVASVVHGTTAVGVLWPCDAGSTRTTCYMLYFMTRTARGLTVSSMRAQRCASVSWTRNLGFAWDSKGEWLTTR